MRMTALLAAATILMAGNIAAASDRFETLNTSDAIMLTDQQMDTVRGGTANFSLLLDPVGLGERISRTVYSQGAEAELVILISPGAIPLRPVIRLVPPSLRDIGPT